MISLLEIASFLLNIVERLGYSGIFLGMTLESSFFPFPSEVVLIPAGALIFEGKMTFVWVFIASMAGSILGSTISYLIALFLGRDTVDFLVKKHGKFLLINHEKLSRYDSFFDRYGEMTIFVSRLIPGVRQIISLPAGFSRMNFAKFIAFTSLGAGIWTIILIYVGYFFGNNSSFIVSNINYIIITAASILILAYLLHRRNSRR